MFCFIAGTMALVDTAVGNMIHYFNDNYSSLYGSIYGYDHLFMNWLWLFLVYILVCSLLYLGILIINKAGKKISLCLGVCFGGIVLLIIALFRCFFSKNHKYCDRISDKGHGLYEWRKNQLPVPYSDFPITHCCIWKWFLCYYSSYRTEIIKSSLSRFWFFPLLLKEDPITFVSSPRIFCHLAAKNFPRHMPARQQTTLPTI